MSLIDELEEDCGFRGNQLDTIKHQVGCPICSKKLEAFFKQCHKNKGTAILCICDNCQKDLESLLGNSNG